MFCIPPPRLRYGGLIIRKGRFADLTPRGKDGRIQEPGGDWRPHSNRAKSKRYTIERLSQVRPHHGGAATTRNPFASVIPGAHLRGPFFLLTGGNSWKKNPADIVTL